MASFSANNDQTLASIPITEVSTQSALGPRVYSLPRSDRSRPGSLQSHLVEEVPVIKYAESVPVWEQQRSYAADQLVPYPRYASLEPRYAEPRYVETESRLTPRYVIAERKEERKPEALPVEEETFTSQAYNQVIKPIGVGIGSPIAGAAGFVGGVAFGAASVCRGVFGSIPLYIDWVVKPASNTIGDGVNWVDQKVRGVVTGPTEIPALQAPTEVEEVRSRVIVPSSYPYATPLSTYGYAPSSTSRLPASTSISVPMSDTRLPASRMVSCERIAVEPRTLAPSQLYASDATRRYGEVILGPPGSIPRPGTLPPSTSGSMILQEQNYS